MVGAGGDILKALGKAKGGPAGSYKQLPKSPKEPLRLVLKPGTHTSEAATSRDGVALATRLGDAVIFDTRLWHRPVVPGHPQDRQLHHAESRRHEHDSRQPKQRRQRAPKRRALLTLSYGLGSALDARTRPRWRYVTGYSTTGAMQPQRSGRAGRDAGRLCDACAWWPTI